MLKEKLLSKIHSAVMKSLSLSHRLSFTVMLTLHALSSDEELPEDEHTWVLQLSTKLGLECSPEDPPPKWLPTSLINVWPLVTSLRDLKDFQGLEDSLQKDKIQWEKFLKEEDPSLELLPFPWNSLKPLYSLILVAVVLPGQIEKVATQMVNEILGSSFACPPSFNLSSLLQSNNDIKGISNSGLQAPLLMITESGVDPLEEIIKLSAKRPNLSVSVVSLGEGQEEYAESAVNIALHNGGWVILQNVHHAQNWLPKLSKIVNEISESSTTKAKAIFGFEPHPEFRLILTTQPEAEFPVGLLRQVEKVTLSPPVDAKEGLIKSVELMIKECSSWGLDDLDMDAEEAAILYRLLHGLAVFHVLVSERGRHGRRAWAAAPTFTQSDLMLSLRCVRLMVESGRTLEKKAIEHLVGRIIYGGRIRRPQDEFVILSLLREVLKIALQPLQEQDEELSESDNEEEGNCFSDNKETTHEQDSRDHETEIALLFPDYIGELSDLLDYVKSIESLDHPEYFGLPRSVKSIQAVKRGEELLTALTKLGGSVEEFCTESESTTSLLIQFKNKLPKPIVLEEKFLLDLPDEDMADVIQRETEGLNCTIYSVISTLDSAILLLKTGNSCGKVEVAEDVIKNISIGRIPSIWETFDSLQTPQILQSFLNILWMRNIFLKKWIDNDCPSKFWLGNFQYLPAFLSLILRQAALLKNIPLHCVCWKFEFTETKSPDPAYLLQEMTQTIEELSDEKSEPFDKEREDAGKAKILCEKGFRKNDYGQNKYMKSDISNSKSSTKWKRLSEDGLLVYGLWLVGAAWDIERRQLYDAPSSQMIQLLPLIKMIPKETSQKDKDHNLRTDNSSEQNEEDSKNENEDDLYECPVYEGGPESSQPPVVFSIPLSPGPKGSNHWIQRRVAIYTSKH